MSAVVRLEHPNFSVGEVMEDVADWMEENLLIFRDPESNAASVGEKKVLWMNVSPREQIHLPNGTPIQSLHTPDSEILLQSDKEELFTGQKGQSLTRICPYNGLRFNLTFGPEPALLGMRIGCHRSSLPHLARFWRNIIGALVEEAADMIRVDVGRDPYPQYLHFFATSETVVITGYHICIYLEFDDWKKTFEACKAQNLVLMPEQHEHNDHVRTFEDALHWKQFRCSHVLDSNRDVSFELELEIRHTGHRHFRNDRALGKRRC